MKQCILFAMAGLLVLTLVTQPAQAQESPVMTDAHIARIKANCRDALTTLQQLHASDGPLRVNRGQLYDAISTKLMARLNSRLAQSRLDASSLVKTTSEYDAALSDFRDHYKAYDDQMSAVLGIDCRKRPVTFYDAVTKARQLRKAVHDDVVTMHRLVDEYRTAFITFNQTFTANSSRKAE